MAKELWPSFQWEIRVSVLSFGSGLAEVVCLTKRMWQEWCSGTSRLGHEKLCSFLGPRGHSLGAVGHHGSSRASWDFQTLSAPVNSPREVQSVLPPHHGRRHVREAIGILQTSPSVSCLPCRDLSQCHVVQKKHPVESCRSSWSTKPWDTMTVALSVGLVMC